MLGMRRRLFTILSVLSLLLCAATVVAWFDSIDLTDRGANLRVFWHDMGRSGETRYVLQSIDGGVWFLSYDTARELTNRRRSSSGSWVLRGIPGTVADRDFTPTNGRTDFGLAGFAFDWVCAYGDVPIGALGIAAIPYWPLVFAFCILPAIACRRLFRIRKGMALAAHNHCSNCSYNLTGNVSGVCLECGTETKTPASAAGGNFTLARVLLEHEAWLFDNDAAKAVVLEGLAQAKAGKFAKDPPNLDGDDKLARQLEGET
jgi:hypothetical protein